MMQAQTTSAFSTQYNYPSSVSATVSRLRAPEDERYYVPESNFAWRYSIIERLQILTNLEIGWDGYQGRPVSFENATFALKMLEVICPDDAPAPQIVPGASGDLQIEWHTHSADIELHVIAPNNVHAWIANEKTGPDGKDVSLIIDFTAVAQEIRKITECSSGQAAA